MVKEETHCAAPPGAFIVSGGEETDSSRTDSLARRQVNSRHARRLSGSARQAGASSALGRSQGCRQTTNAGRSCGGSRGSVESPSVLEAQHLDACHQVLTTLRCRRNACRGVGAAGENQGSLQGGIARARGSETSGEVAPIHQGSLRAFQADPGRRSLIQAKRSHEGAPAHRGCDAGNADQEGTAEAVDCDGNLRCNSNTTAGDSETGAGGTWGEVALA